MRRFPGHSLRASCVGARVQPASSHQRIPVGPLWLVDVARVLLSWRGFALSLRSLSSQEQGKRSIQGRDALGPGGCLSSASPISARAFSLLIPNGSSAVCTEQEPISVLRNNLPFVAAPPPPSGSDLRRICERLDVKLVGPTRQLYARSFPASRGAK